jgi:NAD(P)-dependent dehydrogenase (short-subunit alcohol dehydrogenase family)
LYNLVDAALEVSVVGSFSRIGPSIRRRLGKWQAPNADALAGQTALVTGPTSGLGRATAFALAACGARLVLAGRDEEKLEQLRRELAQRPGRRDGHGILVVDTSSLDSIRRAAEELRSTEARLDVFVDNAGAMHSEYGDTSEGIERTLAVLAVGPWLLTSLLLPLLSAAPDGRVINVTSGGMYAQGVDLDDLHWRQRPFSGARMYAQSKRIQVALMREWARRGRDGTVSFNAMHPGWADTPGLADALPGFYRVMRPLLRTDDEAVDTITWLATERDLEPPGGLLYLDRRPRPFDRVPSTRLNASDRRRLWNQVAALAER